ncbi:MAG: hypothetical protein K2G45_07200 [Lachnospiraceae bacterium]|nr:hypothetical protein [Lachnospiraceae bacterium]
MAKALIPILALIFVGVLINKIRFASKDTIAGMKSIASNVFLPVVIFNALATASFSRDTIFIFCITMFVLLAGFGIGFGTKKLYNKEYVDYIPFVTVTFEGGMLGYALAEVLFGKDGLYHIATIDLAGAVFSFTLWITMIERLQGRTTEGVKRKSLIKSMLTTPTLIAAIAGLICGLSGMGNMLVNSQAGDVYNSIVDMFSAPLTPIILISLGYGMNISGENIKDAIAIIIQRIIVVGVTFLAAFLVFGRFVTFTRELTLSMILYFTLPPSFLLSVYVKGEKSQNVISCVLSLYIIITLAVFCVLLCTK